MPYKPVEIEGMLIRKLAMKPVNKDHKWFVLQFDGLPKIRTKLSNNKKDVGAKLLGRISKQLRIRRPFFSGLMDCTKTRKDYELQVRNDPFPPFDIIIV